MKVVSKPMWARAATSEDDVFVRVEGTAEVIRNLVASLTKESLSVQLAASSCTVNGPHSA